MNKVIAIKVNGYRITPAKLVNGSRLFKTIKIDTRRIALEMAKDSRCPSFSTFSLKVPSVLEYQTTLLKEKLEGWLVNEDEFRIKYEEIPLQKHHRIYLSFSLGTAIGRVILQEYLGVLALDNIDFYYQTYLKHSDVRLDSLNKLLVRKIEDGDGPDALCLNVDGTICLGEFKGRLDSKINHRNYTAWKKQFAVVKIEPIDQTVVSNINHICATSFATSRKLRHFTTSHIIDPIGNKIAPIKLETSAEKIFLHHYYNCLLSSGFRDLAAQFNPETISNSKGRRVAAPEVPIEINGNRYYLPNIEHLNFKIPNSSRIVYSIAIEEKYYNVLRTAYETMDLSVLIKSLREIANTKMSGDSITDYDNVITSLDGFALIPRNKQSE